MLDGILRNPVFHVRNLSGFLAASDATINLV